MFNLETLLAIIHHAEQLHMLTTCVCRQLYVLRASHALVQATVGVGTIIIVYIGVAYTGGGYLSSGRSGYGVVGLRPCPPVL